MSMTPVAVAFRLLAGGLLILANGFFVAIEFALTRARQYSESEFDEPGLRRAWQMTDDLELYLTSCQVGITASSIGVGVVAEPALAGIFEPLFAGSALAAIGFGGVLAFLIINLVHLTHGEQTPTYLGVERTKFVCRYGATPLYYFYRLIAPIIRLGDGIAKLTLRLFGVEMSGAWLETGVDSIESRAELRTALGDVLERSDLPEERREEIRNALRVGDQEVREWMTPAADVVALSTTVDYDENLRRIGAHPHTRYPLVGETLEDIRGIIYLPRLAQEPERFATGDLDLVAVAAPPMTVGADVSVSDAIDSFQTQGQELALVRENGDVVGLITVTDGLEAVMGQITDPIDRELGIG
jgi:CBS domain containing-hemolysin-like protein